MANRAIELIPTRCAICRTEGNAREIHRANFTAELDPVVFSARRLPDRVHYRMVKCRSCGLVRSDPVLPFENLARLYRESAFTYLDEVPDLRDTYGRHLRRLERMGAGRDALLEIGCGNGFFLEEALDQGYRMVRGVEPSRDAVERASPRVRAHLVCDVMREGLFAPETFDVVCLFQVFDHLPDPGAVLDAIRAVLRPGGLVLAINHDVESISARVLGKRSPIIDVEHTYLYSAATMSRVFLNHGFEVVRTGSVWNRYALRYLAQLIPAPVGPKRVLLRALRAHPIGRWRMRVPLGNLHLVGRRPATSKGHAAS